MTVQKELFVQGLLAGKTRYEAYCFAFPEDRKKNKRTVENKASRLAKQQAVEARLEELRNGVRKDTAVSLGEFVLELQKIALGNVDLSGLKIQDKLRALELLAKVLNLSNASAAQQDEEATTFERMVKELYERTDEEAEAVSD